VVVDWIVVAFADDAVVENAAVVAVVALCTRRWVLAAAAVVVSLCSDVENVYWRPR